MTLKQISSCEVCGNDALERVLDLGLHPLCDDLVPVGDPRVCNEYPIDILFCPRCVTAHQRFQVPKGELFPKTYHYRSRFTADVLNGMAALVDSCAERLGGLTGKVVLDIGCNDASLLDAFRRKGAVTVGLEPTGACADGLGKGHALYNDFLSLAAAHAIQAKHGRPDVITLTNVFAHIEDLPAVLAALKVLMSPKTVLVIENHHLGAVLDRCQFDTFYHEHPRTYSLSSFRQIAKDLGVALSAVEFPSRYGGNIRAFLNLPGTADASEGAVDAALRAEELYGEKFAQMRANAQVWRADMSRRIGELRARHGKLSAKAFPGRSAILVRLLGVDSDTIEAVYEKPGSMKIGHYVPGTRIPIRSDDELFARPPPVLLNLAWHISAEINAYLRQHGYEGAVIDILDPQSLPGRG
jgi:hypothetical protein